MIDMDKLHKMVNPIPEGIQKLLEIQNQVSSQMNYANSSFGVMEVQRRMQDSNVLAQSNVVMQNDMMRNWETILRMTQQNSWVENLNNIISNIGNTTLQMQQVIEDTIANTERIQKSPIFQRRRIGALNWVLPIQVRQLNELEESSNLDEDIEKIYFDDDAKLFKEMVTTISSSKYMKRRQEIFDEAVSAYNMGMYKVSCSALAPMVEWLLIDEEDKTSITIKHMNKKLQNKFSEVGINQPCVHILFAFNEFINNYIEYVPFDKKEPELLNRHWLMHGRMTRPITKYHCLQLISALYAIVELLEVEIDDSKSA